MRDIVGGGGGDATSVWGIVEATGGGHGATGGQRPSVWAMGGRGDGGVDKTGRGGARRRVGSGSRRGRLCVELLMRGRWCALGVDEKGKHLLKEVLMRRWETVLCVWERRSFEQVVFVRFDPFAPPYGVRTGSAKAHLKRNVNVVLEYNGSLRGARRLTTQSREPQMVSVGSSLRELYDAFVRMATFNHRRRVQSGERVGKSPCIVSIIFLWGHSQTMMLQRGLSSLFLLLLGLCSWGPLLQVR